MRLLEGDGLIVMRLFGVGPVLGFQLKSDYEGAQAAVLAEHKNCVLERWINPSAARFCKSLVGGQLSAAPPLFPVVHSLPPAPYLTPE